MDEQTETFTLVAAFEARKNALRKSPRDLNAEDLERWDIE